MSIIELIWLLGKLRLLWQFRGLRIKLHTKWTLLIITQDVSLICVGFQYIPKNRHCFTAI